MKASGVISGIIFIILSIIFYLETSSFPGSPGQDVGAAFWPRFLLILLVIFSVILIIASLRSKADSEEVSQNKTSWKLKFKHLIKPILGMISCIFFVLFFQLIGFVISTICIYIILAAIMHDKMTKKAFSIIVVQAVVVVSVVYLLFGELLNVSLPQGVFFF